jgi:DNA polymerase type B, organellar and viral
VFSKYIDNFSEIKIQAEKDNNNARRTVAKLMLNSLYGRFGLRYEPYTIDFVSAKEAANIAIEHEILENIIIDKDNDIEFIKYTTAPSQILKEIDKEKYYNLTQTTNFDGNFVVRSLPISAMTTSYGAIEMNPFLNMEDNPCYYTDTDSCFLQKPLDDKYVGKELGKLSFKGKIKRAYFISPKTYCLVMDNDEVIIRSKGIPNKLLNETDFKKLLLGKTVKIRSRKIFSVLKRTTAGIKHMDINIRPENINRLPIYPLALGLSGKGKNKIIIDTITYHVENGVLQTS